MRKIKIAQIGTSANSHGCQVFNSLKQLDDVFEIVGYAFPEGEAEKFPWLMHHFDGYRLMTVEEILNNPQIEAVTIETEEAYLTKYAILAATAGKAIHMEKPGGFDVKEFEQLVEIVKQKNVLFHTGYMYRHNPVIQNLIAQIQSGEFGEIISVEAQMSCTHEPQIRQWLGTLPGGMTFFLGCHLIDLIYSIQGKPQHIIPLNRSTGLNGISAIDNGMVVFEYPNGVSFFKTCSVEHGGFMRRQLVVTGTKKSVEIKPFEVLDGNDFIHTDYVFRTSREWQTDEKPQSSLSFQRYGVMMQDFADILNGKKENKYSPDYELELFRLILQCCIIE